MTLRRGNVIRKLQRSICNNRQNEVAEKIATIHLQ